MGRDRAVLASSKADVSLLRFDHHQEFLAVAKREPPVGPVAHVDVFDVGSVALGIRDAAATFSIWF